MSCLPMLFIMAVIIRNVFSSAFLTFPRPRSLDVQRKCALTFPLRQRRSFSASDNDNQQTALTLDEGNFVEEMVVKKSRFIGYAQKCQTWDAAQQYLAKIRKEHPKSRHICFGFVAGTNPVQERSSDDGEPTGTAGAPILGAIKGENLSDTVCAVVRYFGGIKLGAGGLIRAYGGAARLVLRGAPKQKLIAMSALRVYLTDVSYAGSVYDTAHRWGGITGDELYKDSGEMEVTVTCETSKVDSFKEAVSDATRGNVKFVHGVK